MTQVRGRVRKFGDHVNTDLITPGSTLQLPMDELKKHAFSLIHPEFYTTIKQGDIVIGGENFGCGSSREQATAVIKELGIRFIVCESIARIYFRNCVALGVYPILAKGVSHIFEEGDDIEIDLGERKVKNPKTGKTISFEPLSGMLLEIFKSGGILAVLRKKVEQDQRN